MRKDFDIVGSYNNQRITSIDAERTINLFEYIDVNGKRPKSLIFTSGIENTHLSFLPETGGSRASFVFKNSVYKVFGGSVFKITGFTGALTVTKIGSLVSSSGYVGVDANTHEVIFVDGQKGYVWNTNTSTFSTITDSNFPTRPIDVTALDGFFVIANGDTNEFRLSQFNDGKNYTPLQQGTITSHPGNIVACRTLHRRLFLFSEFYTEVWENAGIGTNLPFRRNNSSLMEVGTPAIGSIRVGFDRMYFLSQDKDGLGSVMEVAGTEARPISNRALDFQLSQYAARSQAGITFVSDANGIILKENGLIFYRLNFTSANHTFVYNASMSDPENPRWHEEELLNGNRHPAQTHFFYQGINYYGDYRTSKLYITDSSILYNDNDDIHRVRIGKAVSPEGYNRLRIDRFHLDLLQGQQIDEPGEEVDILTESGTDNLTTEAGIPLIIDDPQFIVSDQNPMVYLSISKDGGQTYGHKIQAPMGKIGERSFRTVWRKLGTIPRGQAFVPKIEFYNHTPFVILGAAWDFEVMPE